MKKIVDQSAGFSSAKRLFLSRCFLARKSRYVYNRYICRKSVWIFLLNSARARYVEVERDIYWWFSNIYTRFQKRCNLKIYIKYIYTFSFLIKKWWPFSSDNLATRFLQCRLSPLPQRHAFDTRPPSSHGVLAQWLRCDRVQAWLPILQCRLSTLMNETSSFQPAIPAFKRKLSPQVFAAPPKPAALDFQPPSKCRIM